MKRQPHARRSPAAPTRAKEDSPSAADRLVDLARRCYRFGVSAEQEAFAVNVNGPNLAMMLKGGGDGLRSAMAHTYREEFGKTPCASALNDALMVLAGGALRSTPEPVFLRLAPYDGGVVIDLGTPDGRAVIVRASDWEVVHQSPVLFRRTALTAALPVPERGGRLNDLQSLLGLADGDWSMVVGWLVAALMPDIPHPLLLLSGLQGSGKSFAARVLVDLVDPSTAPLRSEPKDLDQWHFTASGSWAVAVDNISRIPAWFSDALCKASTGDGVVRRRLYTDGELTVVAFRRAVILTSIDAGALRDDLGERLLAVDLPGIRDRQRQTEKSLIEEFGRLRPRLFGALLDALSAVLRELPDVRVGSLPRMADFAKVLLAMDARGLTLNASAHFTSQRVRIAEDVIEADAFGTAIVSFVRQRGRWEGTATQLLEALLQYRGCRNGLSGVWPTQPNKARSQLNRLIPALRFHGLEVRCGKVAGTRFIRLTMSEAAPAGGDAEVAWLREVPLAEHVLVGVDEQDDPDDRCAASSP